MPIAVYKKRSIMAFDPIRTIQSRTLVLAQDNIDTDQIIPARFLTTTSREGLGKAAFYDWRYGDDGKVLPNSPLDHIDRTEHQILVAGSNFGCGSSREHAPWALYDYGFRVVISSDIADIFTSNSLKNGLLPIIVDEKMHAWLLENPGQLVSVDLEAEQLVADTMKVSFSIERFARQCLLDGVDTLGALLKYEHEIAAYEAAR